MQMNTQFVIQKESGGSIYIGIGSFYWKIERAVRYPAKWQIYSCQGLEGSKIFYTDKLSEAVNILRNIIAKEIMNDITLKLLK